MSGLETLLDQDRPIRLLTAAVTSGNLPHAFLFTGPEGVGKKTAARTLAMLLNCRCSQRGRKNRPASEEADACGEKPPAPCRECASCRKILSANHPDLHWLSPSGSYIKVDQVRELCRRLSLKSHEAEIRLAVIENAHSLNPESGNTLLKVLEEPPEKTLFILLARQTSELLPTIVSRCRHIRFNPVSAGTIQAHLQKQWQITEAEAEGIAAMAGGSLSRAAEMTEKNWIIRRNWIIESLAGINRVPRNSQLALAEALARDTDRARTALEIMKTWYRDLAVCAYAPDRLINSDLREKITEESRQYNLPQLIAIVRAIDDAAIHIEKNANLRLAVDQLILEIASKGNRKNGENHRYPV
ncbi:MAG TPA: DNA polymerase III subunit delta' [Desulfosalsimonadaceae bacterium]|nr:DNA polymerase III subunit delta' [Desulfosalsimonadaceae bacterium]